MVSAPGKPTTKLSMGWVGSVLAALSRLTMLAGSSQSWLQPLQSLKPARLENWAQLMVPSVTMKRMRLPVWGQAFSSEMEVLIAS